MVTPIGDAIGGEKRFLPVDKVVDAVGAEAEGEQRETHWLSLTSHTVEK